MKAKILLPLLVLLLPVDLGAQPAQTDTGERIDEVEVVGQRLDELRFEIEANRITIYELFNELNVDDQFDMHCYRRKTTGSLIKERICVPRFVEDALQNAANLQARGMDAPLITGRVSAGNREMRDKMVELANANPELQSAILDLQDLVDEYAKVTDTCVTGAC